MHVMKITEQQRDILDWARESMDSFLDSDPDEADYTHDALFSLHPGPLASFPDKDPGFRNMLEDLYYRLEEQYRDMADDVKNEHPVAVNDARIAKNLATRLRKAFHST